MDTSKVTDMSQMFLNCHSLKELDLSDFKTNQVENMSHMFAGCSGLQTLDITKFDTSKVTDMSGMFAGCETLEELDLSNFDTKKVKTMSNMFESSSALKSLKLGEKFVVPAKPKEDLKLADHMWVSVGKGTRNNPKPSDKKGITSEELLSQSNRGNWVVRPDKEYHGPSTVQINSNLTENLVVNVPEEIKPDFVGSTFTIPVPQKDGYHADKENVTVMALENKLSSTDVVSYVADKKQSAPKKEISDKDEGTITEFNKYVTVHPDLKFAQLYDANGMKIDSQILDKNYTWFSNRQKDLDGQIYYRTPSNAWVKASDVYECTNSKNLVKTRDAIITELVNSHAQTIVNRGLGAFSTWKTTNVAILNNHKYYQISPNEFVDSDKVDLVKA
ncbi:hypothetical protein LCR01_04540 [Companilactobacillus crustorum]|uniref:Membrane associated lipoprotein n=3 Tax=Companilactobacillus TaxID=2767879 RepID=A0A837RKF0_9LACO|nr:BspA family leucine-rich repeat surface protein [Companilactobacillus crustorum]KRK44513.1 membrane associated lipoprotein [Companilactobacillus crustorum JCM 15951]KRO21836.1 membrane associated lipoprotein [Companilactobacillus crustorum]GEO76011.1 hypothetical protein LCR01_04540 [Companilactobacillus crustorum]